MLVSMIISLYTSRVVLNELGVEDFGVYNVVGGVVLMLGFVNSAMAASTQRFLTFEIGKNDKGQLRKVFLMSVTIHLIIAILILIVAETIGIWFVDSYMNIPYSRMHSALWVYHLSVFSFVIMVLSVPYNALIIAHERMKTFALIGMLEVFMKLGVVVVLVFFDYDKLILYAALLFMISFVIRIIYGVYCNTQFEEARSYKLLWDKDLFISMGNFAGWNLLGVTAGLAYNQGVNILLNIFFGPMINASRGIAFQVQSAVNSFVYNFQVAVNPSITKLYAKGDTDASFKLVFSSSKFSFYLLLLLSMPLILETERVLILWLGIVPQYTVIFTRLVLIDILIGSISGSIQCLVQATGKIRKYQLIISGILLLNLPTSYLLLKIGYSPEYTIIISIVYSLIALFARLRILKNLTKFPVKEFIVSVLSRILLVSFIAGFIGVYLENSITESSWKFFYVGGMISLALIFSIFAIGLNVSERKLIKRQALKLINKIMI